MGICWLFFVFCFYTQQVLKSSLALNVTYPFKKTCASGHQVSGRWHPRWCCHLLSLYAWAPRDDWFTIVLITVEGALRQVSDFSVVTLLSFCSLVCMAEKVCFVLFFKLHTSYAKVKVQPKPDPLLSPPGQACKLTAVPQWVPHILYFQVGFRHLQFLASETLWYLTSILLHTEPLSFSNRDKQRRKVSEKATWIFCLT